MAARTSAAEVDDKGDDDEMGEDNSDDEDNSDEEEDDDDEVDDDEAAPVPRLHKDNPSPEIKGDGTTIALGKVELKLLCQLADPDRPLQVSPTATAEDLVSNLWRSLNANTIAATADAVTQRTALVHHRSASGKGQIGFTLILEFRSRVGGLEIAALLEKMGLMVTIVAPGRMRQSKAAGKRPAERSTPPRSAKAQLS